MRLYNETADSPILNPEEAFSRLPESSQQGYARLAGSESTKDQHIGEYKKNLLINYKSQRSGLPASVVAKTLKHTGSNIDQEFSNVQNYLNNQVKLKEFKDSYYSDSYFMDRASLGGRTVGEVALMVGQGLTQTAGGLDIFAQWFLDPEATKKAEPLKQKQVFDDMYEGLRGVREQNRKLWNVPQEVEESFSGMLIQGGGQLGAMIAVGLLTRSSSAVMAAAYNQEVTSYLDRYEQELGKTLAEMTYEERVNGNAMSNAYGLGSALLEVLTPMTLMKSMKLEGFEGVRNLKNSGDVRNAFLKEVGKMGTQEFSTEFLQGTLQDALIDLGTDKGLGNVFTMERLRNNLLEATVGMILGSGVGSISAYYKYPARYKQYQQEFTTKKNLLSTAEGRPLTQEEADRLAETINEQDIEDIYSDRADKDEIKAVLRGEEGSLERYNQKVYQDIKEDATEEQTQEAPSGEKIITTDKGTFYYDINGKGSLVQDTDRGQLLQKHFEEKQKAELAEQNNRIQQEVESAIEEFEITRTQIEKTAKAKKQPMRPNIAISDGVATLTIGKRQYAYKTEAEAREAQDRYISAMDRLSAKYKELTLDRSEEGKRRLNKWKRPIAQKPIITETLNEDGTITIKSNDGRLNATGNREAVDKERLAYLEDTAHTVDVAKLSEILQDLAGGRLNIEDVKEARSLQQDIEEGVITVEQAQAIKKAAGLDPEADNNELYIKGRYTPIDDTIRVFRDGDVLTLVEEKSHHFVNKQVAAEGQQFWDKVAKWRQEVSTALKQDLPEVDVTTPEGQRVLDEWFSARAVEYTVGKAVDPTVNEANPFRKFFLRLKLYVQDVIERALDLHYLRNEGLVDRELFTYLEASMGIDIVNEFVAQNRGDLAGQYRTQEFYEEMFGLTEDQKQRLDVLSQATYLQPSLRKTTEEEYQDLFGLSEEQKEIFDVLSNAIYLQPSLRKTTAEEYADIFNAIDDDTYQSYIELFKQGYREPSILPTTKKEYEDIFGAVDQETYKAYQDLFKQLKREPSILERTTEAEYKQLFGETSEKGRMYQDVFAMADLPRTPFEYLQNMESFKNAQDVRYSIAMGKRTELESERFETGSEDIRYSITDRAYSPEQEIVDYLAYQNEKQVTDEQIEEASEAVDSTKYEKSDRFYKKKFAEGAIKRVMDGLRTALRVSSARIAKIDPELATRVKKYASDKRRLAQVYINRVQSFSEEFSNLTEQEQLAATRLLNNGQFSQFKSKFKKNPILVEGIDEVRKVLEEVGNKVREVRDFGQIQNYFPRKIKYLDQFMEHMSELYGVDRATDLKRELQNEATKKGGVLTKDEETEVINKFMRSFKRKSTKSTSTKERKINDIPEELIQYYEPAHIALAKYIDTMTNDYLTRELFGQKVLDTESGSLDLEGTIGQYLAGKDLTQDEVALLHRTLGSVVNMEATTGFAAGIRSMGYITSMGQFASTITQLGELAFYLHAGGRNPVKYLGHLAGTVNAETDAEFISMETDMGNNGLIQELQTDAGLAKAVDWVFTRTGLKTFGRRSMEAVMNAGVANIRDRIRNNTLRELDKKFLREAFGKEWESKLDALAQEGNNETVFDLAGAVLQKYYPIDETQLPLGYTENPTIRLAYMLKTFTMKQLNLYVDIAVGGFREASRLQEEGDIEAAKQLRKESAYSLMSLGALLFLAGASTDAIKDLFNMGETEELDDYVLDNIWKLAGVSRYNMFAFQDYGFTVGAAKMVAPVVPFLEAPSRDIGKVISGGDFDSIFDTKTFSILPFIGRPLYMRSEAFQERLEARED